LACSEQTNATTLTTLSDPMARVLVTGGAGFIGSHTVDRLLTRGYEVRILDNLQLRVHPRGAPTYLPKEAELVIGDVSNRSDMARVLPGVDYVVHLAAYQDYMPDFSTFIHVNTESCALIFELIVEGRLPVRKLLFASSQSVAGEGTYLCSEHGSVMPDSRSVEQLGRGDWEVRCPQCDRAMTPLPIPETACHPHTTYAVSKYAIELLAKNLGGRYGLPTACMRYTYVQGSRNSFFNAYSGICRRFAMRIANGLPPVCYEDGQQLRDYVNVADVARANVLAMESEADEHAVYNVGGGRAITVLEFARIMLDACESPLKPLVPGEYRLGDTRHTVSDISAMHELGWEPTVKVEQNVTEYLDWMAGFSGTADYLAEAERIMRKQNVVRSVLHR
jgi:dTDP-L-rhamnose 4-epimerase